MGKGCCMITGKPGGTQFATAEIKLMPGVVLFFS
jgi:hypothetical protein